MPAKKITFANFKRFVNQHFGNAKSPLLISTQSEFDGMVDGVTDCKDKSFSVALSRRDSQKHSANDVDSSTLGIQGVWLVGGSRNYFYLYLQDGLLGIKVSNCCGSFIVAVKIPE